MHAPDKLIYDDDELSWMPSYLALELNTSQTLRQDLISKVSLLSTALDIYTN